MSTLAEMDAFLATVDNVGPLPELPITKITENDQDRAATDDQGASDVPVESILPDISDVPDDAAECLHETRDLTLSPLEERLKQHIEIRGSTQLTVAKSVASNETAPSSRLSRSNSMVSTEEEIVSAVSSALGKTHSRLYDAFAVMDTSETGSLSRNELLAGLEAMELGLRENTLLRFIDHVDIDTDGAITFQEFWAVFAKHEHKDMSRQTWFPPSPASSVLPGSFAAAEVAATVEGVEICAASPAETQSSLDNSSIVSSPVAFDTSQSWSPSSAPSHSLQLGVDKVAEHSELRVILHGAYALASSERGGSGTAPTTYVSIRIGGRDKQKSSIRRKSFDPVWGEEFIFGGGNDLKYSGLPSDLNTLLEVTMRHQRRLGRNRTIGRWSMPLWSLLSDEQAKVSKFPETEDSEAGFRLFTRSGTFPINNNAGNCGLLRLTVELRTPLASVSLTQDLTSSRDQENVVEFATLSELGTLKATEVEVPKTTQSIKTVEQPHEAVNGASDNPVSLRVVVWGARDLAPGDRNGLSDPYCIVSVGAATPKKTKVKKKTLDPEFGESFVFKDVARQDLVVVGCKDWDRIGFDDCLGEVRIPVEALLDPMLALNCSRAYHRLKPVKNGSYKVFPTGDLELELEVFDCGNSSVRKVLAESEEPHLVEALSLVEEVPPVQTIGVPSLDSPDTTNATKDDQKVESCKEQNFSQSVDGNKLEQQKGKNPTSLLLQASFIEEVEAVVASAQRTSLIYEAEAMKRREADASTKHSVHASTANSSSQEQRSQRSSPSIPEANEVGCLDDQNRYDKLTDPLKRTATLSAPTKTASPPQSPCITNRTAAMDAGYARAHYDASITTDAPNVIDGLVAELVESSTRTKLEHSRRKDAEQQLLTLRKQIGQAMLEQRQTAVSSTTMKNLRLLPNASSDYSVPSLEMSDVEASRLDSEDASLTLSPWRQNVQSPPMLSPESKQVELQQAPNPIIASAELISLREQLSRLHVERRFLKGEVAAHTNTIRHLTQQNRGQSSDIDALQNRAEQLAVELQTAMSQLEKSKDEVSRLASILSELDTLNEQLRESEAEALKESRMAQADAQRHAAEIGRMGAANTMQQREIDALRLELGRSSDVLRGVTGQGEHDARQNKVLLEELEYARREIDTLREELRVERNAADDAHSRSDVARHEAQQHNYELQSLRNEVRELRRHKVSSTAHLRAARLALQRRKGQRTAAKAIASQTFETVTAAIREDLKSIRCAVHGLFESLQHDIEKLKCAHNAIGQDNVLRNYPPTISSSSSFLYSAPPPVTHETSITSANCSERIASERHRIVCSFSKASRRVSHKINVDLRPNFTRGEVVVVDSNSRKTFLFDRLFAGPDGKGPQLEANNLAKFVLNGGSGCSVTFGPAVGHASGCVINEFFYAIGQLPRGHTPRVSFSCIDVHGETATDVLGPSFAQQLRYRTHGEIAAIRSLRDSQKKKLFFDDRMIEGKGDALLDMGASLVELKSVREALLARTLCNEERVAIATSREGSESQTSCSHMIFTLRVSVPDPNFVGGWRNGRLNLIELESAALPRFSANGVISPAEALHGAIFLSPSHGALVDLLSAPVVKESHYRKCFLTNILRGSLNKTLVHVTLCDPPLNEWELLGALQFARSVRLGGEQRRKSPVQQAAAVINDLNRSRSKGKTRDRPKAGRGKGRELNPSKRMQRLGDNTTSRRLNSSKEVQFTFDYRGGYSSPVDFSKSLRR